MTPFISPNGASRVAERLLSQNPHLYTSFRVTPALFIDPDTLERNRCHKVTMTCTGGAGKWVL